MSNEIKLSTALIQFDTDKKCPFCTKQDWGEEKHDKECPFTIAYKIRDNNL